MEVPQFNSTAGATPVASFFPVESNITAKMFLSTGNSSSVYCNFSWVNANTSTTWTYNATQVNGYFNSTCNSNVTAGASTATLAQMQAFDTIVV